jgi:hypothetical protein
MKSMETEYYHPNAISDEESDQVTYPEETLVNEKNQTTEKNNAIDIQKNLQLENFEVNESVNLNHNNALSDILINSKTKKTKKTKKENILDLGNFENENFKKKKTAQLATSKARAQTLDAEPAVIQNLTSTDESKFKKTENILNSKIAKKIEKPKKITSSNTNFKNRKSKKIDCFIET